MSNKSSQSPSGEDSTNNGHMRKQEVEKEDIQQTTTPEKASPSAVQDVKSQPNQQNNGFEEDQPGNPVRTTGSTREDQETGPAGEPDPGEV